MLSQRDAAFIPMRGAGRSNLRLFCAAGRKAHVDR